ncbi:MAG: methylated-DNA--[protein]-cysteine S-methyltransferase [Alphaproteobacteria bacterium]
MNYIVYESPIGKLWLCEEEGSLTALSFSKTKIPLQVQERETPILVEAKKQLNEYFAEKREKFDLPIKFKGTSFQQKVWKALCQVPYGQTASYKEIAQNIQNEKACRAVGMANNKNPIAIIVPCHRIIGTNGKLVGYAGGLEIKQKLLELERKRK